MVGGLRQLGQDEAVVLLEAGDDLEHERDLAGAGGVKRVQHPFGVDPPRGVSSGGERPVVVGLGVGLLQMDYGGARPSRAATRTGRGRRRSSRGRTCGRRRGRARPGPGGIAVGQQARILGDRRGLRRTAMFSNR